VSIADVSGFAVAALTVAAMSGAFVFLGIEARRLRMPAVQAASWAMAAIIAVGMGGAVLAVAASTLR
jgi:hypothetical protein